jgi:hypothetical protein
LISELALPLPLSIRGDVLELVANRIAGCSEQARGPGLVYRVAVEAQRTLLKTIRGLDVFHTERASAVGNR